MTVVGFPYSLLQGLSSFWTRFFADAPQLDVLYQGAAVQLGQAYLDLMSATLGVSLHDAVALDREYYRMLAMREDEVRFVAGATTADDRWAFSLSDPVVSFASIDNKVVEPTASLEPRLDFDFVGREVRFRQDPTNPYNTGVPLNGYARRATDVSVGGRFTNTAVTDWTVAAACKGDTIRIVDVGIDGTQHRRSDHTIVLVRNVGLYVSSTTPLPPAATGVPFVILRTPAVAQVLSESVTPVTAGAPPVTTLTLVHTRVDQGSVRVYAKGPSGADVVEDVDYIVNYEHGIIYRQTVWQNPMGPFGVDYTWQQEVYPTTGTSPRLSSTGIIVATTTVRVLQIAAWTPTTFVDRLTLSNNFGALIGHQGASSEAYRSFLSGVFQLYILGPVLQRIESALNVVLNLPVVREDDEVYQSTDTSDPLVDYILTTGPLTNQTTSYEFPKGTPLRMDLVTGQTLLSFEPLTTAVTVTDYAQSPDWWYNKTIPRELFQPNGVNTPSVTRRAARPYFVSHVVGAADDPHVGDPGLIVGRDENGFEAMDRDGLPPLRHRMAFVLMDRYLKYHTFSVKFDATALSATSGDTFAQSLLDLNSLVLSAKPSHTYVFTTPTTAFSDEVLTIETDMTFDCHVGPSPYGPDKVIFTDDELVVGSGGWLVGDYFTYQLYTESTVLTTVGVPVAPIHVPTPPRRRRLVRVFVNGAVGGVALVENVDYTVDYVNCTITPLTVWDATTVDVTWRQLDIGNVKDASAVLGDTALYVNEVDPALITAAFDSTAAGWDGIVTPSTAPRDIGMVERAIIVSAHA